MLKWPERARRSLATFFVKWNDFDVFVEDSAKHAGNIYVALLSRIAADRCKIGKVIPLGDRKKVVDAALTDAVVGGRPRLYLIDGDLDLIAGVQAVSVPRLYMHKVYHLENYLLCEEALVHVLHEENPRLTSDEVRVKLDFAGWEAYSTPLLYLFRVFGLTRILDPSLPTISLGVGLFATDNKLDEKKIKSFCASRVSDLEARFPRPDVDAAKRQVDEAVGAFSNSLDVISAREYLMPILKWWVGSRGLRLPAGKESLLFRLSKTCQFERHGGLTDAIAKCAKGKNA